MKKNPHTLHTLKLFPMPELSRFFGIIIRMFFEDGAQHHLPHFHATHGEKEGVFLIVGDDVSPKEGACTLDRKDVRLVLAWAEMNLFELKQAWDQLVSGRWNPDEVKIKPLIK